MAESRIVTFTTDFGLSDAFVGIMHGVVLNIHPETTVVDICHAVASYDLMDGAWTIAQSYRFFPARTVHVVIVDPGVGSERRPIIVETENHVFVAPDNGVLSMVEAREPKFVVRHVTAERYFLQPVSRTFHGRDIFAPIAGWLSKGVAPSEFGPEITDYVRLALPQVEHVGENSLRGAVLKVDKFGNLITNIGQARRTRAVRQQCSGRQHPHRGRDDHARLSFVLRWRRGRDLRDCRKLRVSGDRGEAGVGSGEAGGGRRHADRRGGESRAANVKPRQLVPC